jgi:hypothetical protein
MLCPGSIDQWCSGDPLLKQAIRCTHPETP